MAMQVQDAYPQILGHHRHSYGEGTLLWQRERALVLDPPHEVAWCIYDCPSSPAALIDYGYIRILWSTCGHPTDLGDTAYEQHYERWIARQEAWREPLLPDRSAHSGQGGGRHAHHQHEPTERRGGTDQVALRVSGVQEEAVISASTSAQLARASRSARALVAEIVRPARPYLERIVWWIASRLG